MASLLKTSLWILKSQGRNNKLISPQENIFLELVWITTINILHKVNQLKKLKVKNKTIKWDTAKISDLKIKMFWHIWIIEYNNQRICWHQELDKRHKLLWWIIVVKILRCRIRGKAKVQGDNHTIRFINNNNQIKAQCEETRIKFLVTRCKTISLFKIQGRLLNSKCGNRDMLLKTK